MQGRRAGAAVPDALSFARSALRELVRARWKVEKLRFDLDAEGRGEALYRFTDGRWTFHFFLVALKLSEEEKMDRNWAQSWDAMGVLCQGEWTPEREALLREEVPKQRNGYADYGTLVYARGNRSARFFDHVVERLAAGQQPDLALLARVGYILRSTAFIANGQLGTRAFAGLEPDHPFRRPYHVQMASAFLLREYVFDLVDHIARARNPQAARLDPAHRRYLGIGNAAATGLISFVVNHPHLMHRWTHAREAALAEARGRPRDEARFRALLERAIRYHREGVDERTDLFATAGIVAAELERFQRDADERALGTEAREIVNSILVELHPDLAEAGRESFLADEKIETEPGMKVVALRKLVQTNYDWALQQAEERFFWYRAANTPRENRRGRRGVAPEFQAENGMETAHRARALMDALKESRDDLSVAELLCARPEFRHIVARVQSLADSEYAELRVNWLAPDFSPFEPVRFVLAFYGMEKFESALPKSVRGSFLQGAPIAEDVAEGRDGDWPYPLIPAPGSHPVRLAPLPPAGWGAVRGAPKPSPRSVLRIAPAELQRTVHTAMQGHGAPWGVAEEAAAIVAFAHACGEPALAAMLAQCQSGLAPNGYAMTPTRDREGWRLDARGMAAILAAPAALDLACATREPVAVTNATGAAMLGQLEWRFAERGLVGLVKYAHEGGGFSLAGRCEAAEAARVGTALRNRMDAWQREGLTIAATELAELNRAAAALLVPVVDVPRLRPGEESDPLKMF